MSSADIDEFIGCRVSFTSLNGDEYTGIIIDVSLNDKSITLERPFLKGRLLPKPSIKLYGKNMKDLIVLQIPDEKNNEDEEPPHQSSEKKQLRTSFRKDSISSQESLPPLGFHQNRFSDKQNRPVGHSQRGRFFNRPDPFTSTQHGGFSNQERRKNRPIANSKHRSFSSSRGDSFSSEESRKNMHLQRSKFPSRTSRPFTRGSNSGHKNRTFANSQRFRRRSIASSRSASSGSHKSPPPAPGWKKSLFVSSSENIHYKKTEIKEAQKKHGTKETEKILNVQKVSSSEKIQQKKPEVKETSDSKAQRSIFKKFIVEAKNQPVVTKKSATNPLVQALQNTVQHTHLPSENEAKQKQKVCFYDHKSIVKDVVKNFDELGVSKTKNEKEEPRGVKKLFSNRG